MVSKMVLSIILQCLFFFNYERLFNPLGRISHSSGSHTSYTRAIDYNSIVKELAKKFNYHFTHH